MVSISVLIFYNVSRSSSVNISDFEIVFSFIVDNTENKKILSVSKSISLPVLQKAKIQGILCPFPYFTYNRHKN